MNYYELLGVKNDATEEEIKSAYKRQMKKWHPDINKSDEAIGMSAKINEAKEVLLDEDKRKDYDVYLTKKTEENYNRYTQRRSEKNQNTNNSEKEQVYENKKVSKWEYLKDWLKYGNYSKARKLFGVIGVLLESMLCWGIKVLLIIFSFICNFASYLIRLLFSYIYPIIGIIVLLFIGQCLTNGFYKVLNESPQIFNALIIMILMFISSFILPLISRLIISPKVFDILYNKIDIGLFKKCVGYKD